MLKSYYSIKIIWTLVNDLSSLKEALANHIFRAGEKLRLQKGLCGGLYVFINTNKFRKMIFSIIITDYNI